MLSNPCPCGGRGSSRRDCRRNDGAIARYTARISGPLLDRIDVQVAVLLGSSGSGQSGGFGHFETGSSTRGA
jgi:predicted ATPase with chaperone activity